MDKKVKVLESVKQEDSVANKIWSEIKDKPVEIFALPNQFVNQYCKPVNINPDKLYLIITASAFFPALEVALGKKYSVERVNKYIVVSYAEPEI